MLKSITVTVKQIGKNLYNFPLLNVDFSIEKYRNKYSLVVKNQHFTEMDEIEQQIFLSNNC